MKSKLENIYLNCPILIQNVIASLYGLKLNKRRYSGDYPKYFNHYKENLSLSISQLRMYQFNALKDILETASQSVPYYKKLFTEAKIDIRDIKSIDDLDKLPLLDKQEIRIDPEQFVNSNYNPKRLHVIHTTGTTGTPLKIFCDSEARQKNYAFFDRWLSSVGINISGKRATFGGRIVVPPEQDSPPYWRYSFFQKNLLLSSYHLTEESLTYFVQKLLKYQPDFIDSYPSSLQIIAEFADRNRLDLSEVTRGIITSAEALFTPVRKKIESVFGVPIFDQYGATEMCIFVGQCVEGSYHIHSDYAIVEFIGEDGFKAAPGEEAEIVCTGMVNPVMPLIRYRIGDRGIFSDTPCSCGSPFPVMKKILGRMDDVIVTPDGKRIGRLGSVLKGFPVKEAQYVQKEIDYVDVFIVKDSTYTHDTEGDVLTELRKRVGYQINISIKYVDKIERGKGGKFKTVISSLNRDTVSNSKAN